MSDERVLPYRQWSEEHDAERREVLVLGQRIGFGNMISLALDLWAEYMEDAYGIQGFRAARVKAMALAEEDKVGLE